MSKPKSRLQCSTVCDSKPDITWCIFSNICALFGREWRNCAPQFKFRCCCQWASWQSVKFHSVNFSLSFHTLFLHNVYTDYDAVSASFRSRNALFNKVRKAEIVARRRHLGKRGESTRLLSCRNCVLFTVILMIFSSRIILPRTRKCFDTVGWVPGRASDL